MKLSEKRCKPFTAPADRFDAGQIALFLPEVQGWSADGERLVKTVERADFGAAIRLVDQIAEVAEAENHHPELAVRGGSVEVTFWTHVFGDCGLSENDFIMAAKVDALG